MSIRVCRMTPQEIENIRAEANRIIHKKFPQLENTVRDGVLEYILEAMDNLGYKVRKRK